LSSLWRTGSLCSVRAVEDKRNPDRFLDKARNTIVRRDIPAAGFFAEEKTQIPYVANNRRCFFWFLRIHSENLSIKIVLTFDRTKRTKRKKKRNKRMKEIAYTQKKRRLDGVCVLVSYSRRTVHENSRGRRTWRTCVCVGGNHLGGIPVRRISLRIVEITVSACCCTAMFTLRTTTTTRTAYSGRRRSTEGWREGR